MYVGVLIVVIGTPLALGSYWGLLFLLLTVPILVPGARPPMLNCADRCKEFYSATLTPLCSPMRCLCHAPCNKPHTFKRKGC